MIVSAISLLLASFSLFVAMSPETSFAPALRYSVLAIGALAGVFALAYLVVRGYQPLVRYARRAAARRTALSGELARVSSLIAVAAARAQQDANAISAVTPPAWVSSLATDNVGKAAIAQYRQQIEPQASRLVEAAKHYALDVTATTTAMASIESLDDLLAVASRLAELADRARVVPAAVKG